MFEILENLLWGLLASLVVSCHAPFLCLRWSPLKCLMSALWPTHASCFTKVWETVCLTFDSSFLILPKHSAFRPFSIMSRHASLCCLLLKLSFLLSSRTFSHLDDRSKMNSYKSPAREWGAFPFFESTWILVSTSLVVSITLFKWGQMHPSPKKRTRVKALFLGIIFKRFIFKFQLFPYIDF